MIALCALTLIAPAVLAKNYLPLETKIAKLTRPYGNKVGVAFLDPRTGASFDIRGDRPYPAASVIKMPVMAALYHMSDKGLVNLNAKIPVRKEDKLGGSGVLQWLKPHRETLWNLSRLMISISDNTATRLLVNLLGKENINEYCQVMGLYDTTLYDETALVEPPNQCNLTSPVDMVQLVYLIKYGRKFSPDSTRNMLAAMRNQKYRWGIVKPLPKGVVVANKTGNLTGILNDVGLVTTKKGSYILCIMTKGFPKKRVARKLINQISLATYQYYMK